MRIFLALTCLALGACRDNGATALARGNLLRNQGKGEEAVVAYRAGLDQADGRPTGGLRMALGDALADLGRTDEALNIYRAAAIDGPADPAPRIAAARILTAHNDLAGARAELTVAIELDPRANHARLSRGNLALKAGDSRAAVNDFKDAAARDGRNPVVLYSLLRGLIAHGDVTAASATAQRLSTLAPGTPLAHYGAALAAEARGDRRRALRELAQALEVAPAEARAALQDPALASLRNDPAVVAILAKSQQGQ
jgi:tetratricopeptide (TPR) repeat protein